MLKYEVIFLDVDNTILDFDQAEVYALRKTFEEAGYPYSEAVRTLYHHYNHKLWQSLEKGEIDMETLKHRRFKELVKELGIQMPSEKMSELYMDHLGETDFEVAGAYEMCKALSQNYKLAVMTNGITRVQKSRFKRSRLAQFISCYFISEEIGISKPDPGIFKYAMDQLGVSDPGKCLMIGDSLTSDMKGGENAKIDTCFYDPSDSWTDQKVTYRVRKLSEIPLLLSEAEKNKQ